MSAAGELVGRCACGTLMCCAKWIEMVQPVVVQGSSNQRASHACHKLSMEESKGWSSLIIQGVHSRCVQFSMVGNSCCQAVHRHPCDAFDFYCWGPLPTLTPLRILRSPAGSIVYTTPNQGQPASGESGHKLMNPPPGNHLSLEVNHKWLTIL